MQQDTTVENLKHRLDLVKADIYHYEIQISEFQKLRDDAVRKRTALEKQIREKNGD